jgi:hypothetical protein
MKRSTPQPISPPPRNPGALGANIVAIETLHRLRVAQRPATAAEQRVLAAWSGWGAVPDVFDTREETFAAERDQLRALLSRDEYTRAEASVLNAHYTDPAIVAVVWTR